MSFVGYAQLLTQMGLTIFELATHARLGAYPQFMYR